ncbi:MAG: septum formation initiator family protein [Thermoanaerobaculia bacterium]
MPQFASARNPAPTTRVTIRAVLLLSGVLTIVFLVSFIFSEEGIAELRDARMRVDSLRTEVERLQRENDQLQGEIESLRASDFAVEKIAREDLGMSRPGELIYMLPDPPAAVPATPTR